MISLCLSTMSVRVGLCTLPTERKLLPIWPLASEMNLVRTAPQARSMTCLVSADSANRWSGSVSCLNAPSISNLVRALKRTRRTERGGFSRSDTVSSPMSSPSRSKSVAIMTSSHSMASSLNVCRMLRAVTLLAGWALTRSLGSTLDQSLNSGG
ncbi:hypothetical protein DSECCO2_326490 [anaerobic digester metagenome]